MINLNHKKWPLRQFLVEYFDIPITTLRGRKLGYALPMKTRYEATENFLKIYEILDCMNHKDKICILSRLKRINVLSTVINSLKSETDSAMSSCSNSPERPTPEELEMEKPLKPKIETLRGKNDGRTARCHQGCVR